MNIEIDDNLLKSLRLTATDVCEIIPFCKLAAIKELKRHKFITAKDPSIGKGKRDYYSFDDLVKIQIFRRAKRYGISRSKIYEIINSKIISDFIEFNSIETCDFEDIDTKITIKISKIRKDLIEELYRLGKI